MLIADNVMSEHFGGGVLFMDTSERERVVTGDRTAFIGRNRTLANAPRARAGMAAGRVGAALDPCGVVQVDGDAGRRGDARGRRFVLGHAADVDAARDLAARFRDPAAAQAAQATARWPAWHDRLQRVQIRTPDPALDVMVNRWLLYQTLACRVWGRTAFYQSSGAFGFRDQLQDVLALLWVDPALARDAAAARGLAAVRRGRRAALVARARRPRRPDPVLRRPALDDLRRAALRRRRPATSAVLDEVVPFLAGRRLEPDEHEVYQPAVTSTERGTLFEHCARAIDISLDSRRPRPAR